MIQSRKQNQHQSDTPITGVRRTWTTEPVISQDELQRLVELREFNKQQKELLRTIKKKYEQGCATEPGRLSLEVKKCQSRSFSFEKVASILGRDKTEELREQIPVSTATHFKVVDTP